jgi:uncharacterized protein
VRWFVVLVALAACSQSGGRRQEDAMADQRGQGKLNAAPKVAFAAAQGEVVVEVEVVSTPAKISNGLMFREHLAPEAGMLFLMGSESDWAFYMRNTLIPLDMIFITRDLVVAGVVANATPRTEEHRKVGRPSTYVLEVNGGWAAAHQVAAGTKVRFEGVKAQ